MDDNDSFIYIPFTSHSHSIYIPLNLYSHDMPMNPYQNPIQKKNELFTPGPGLFNACVARFSRPGQLLRGQRSVGWPRALLEAGPAGVLHRGVAIQLWIHPGAVS